MAASPRPATNSSVVLYGSFEKGNVLLTGDAGVRGLTWAANMADYLGLPLQKFSFVQIPHHGSRRNIGPTILTRLVGNKQLETEPTRFTAFSLHRRMTRSIRKRWFSTPSSGGVVSSTLPKARTSSTMGASRNGLTTTPCRPCHSSPGLRTIRDSAWLRTLGTELARAPFMSAPCQLCDVSAPGLDRRRTPARFPGRWRCP